MNAAVALPAVVIEASVNDSGGLATGSIFRRARNWCIHRRDRSSEKLTSGGVRSAACIDARAEQIAEELRQAVSRLTVASPVGIDEATFQGKIQSALGQVDFAVENWTELSAARQRDMSVKFQWGHDHDSGTFKLDGRMGQRHIVVTSNFMSLFDLPLSWFQDKRIFDVGC